MVLLLAVILPIAISFSYFQDAPNSSTGNLQIQTATNSATPEPAIDTPPPVQPIKTVRQAELAQGNNCTYPADHWLASTQNWPAEITIGNLYYTQEQAVEFVTTQPSQVFNVLFIQVHSAYLNILSGASQSQIVKPMLEAIDWLNKALDDSENAKSGQERALELAETIQAYNDGEIGPGRCAAYTPPSRLFNNKISAAVLSLTPDTSLVAGQTNDPLLQTPTRAIRTPASGLPALFVTATSTPTHRSNPGPAPIPSTLQPSATPAPPTAQPTSPPPTDTARPVEPTSTSAPPQEPTPTSPPP